MNHRVRNVRTYTASDISISRSISSTRVHTKYECMVSLNEGLIWCLLTKKEKRSGK